VQDARHQGRGERVKERQATGTRVRVEQPRQVLAQLVIAPGDVAGGGEGDLALLYSTQALWPIGDTGGAWYGTGMAE
jgi:hypothetical protein